MKITKEIPDKTIELSHGDCVKIYIRKNEILFSFFCDGDGNGFVLSKEELKEMTK